MRKRNRRKYQPSAYATGKMVDPTPEEIAAWRAAQPIRTHGHDSTKPDANFAPFYRWLWDADNVAPLKAAVPEVE